jgi:hypothetical protein
MLNLDNLSTDKAATTVRVATYTRFAHRRGNVLSEALWAERLMRFCFVVPEWSAELEAIGS